MVKQWQERDIKDIAGEEASKSHKYIVLWITWGFVVWVVFLMLVGIFYFTRNLEPWNELLSGIPINLSESTSLSWLLGILAVIIIGSVIPRIFLKRYQKKIEARMLNENEDLIPHTEVES